MRFDERWMGECQTEHLGRLALSVKNLPNGEYVEIGVWQGWSAIPIAQAIDPAVLHCVDHWQGDASGSIPPELLARDNKGIFLANVKESGLPIAVYDMGWREWLDGFTERIRFLHLDASHTADEVADNIKAVMPAMVPGGILAGDDWDWPEVRKGIVRAIPDLDQKVSVLWDKLWWVTT